MFTTLLAPPDHEPVTLEEAKAHLRASDGEDDLIMMAVSAARQYAEQYTRRSLVPQTWQVTLEEFPSGEGIRLPYPPVIEVTEIAYTDAAGVSGTVDTFHVVGHPVQPEVWPVYGSIWPASRAYGGSVTVTYRAGYAHAGLIPSPIVHAILMMTGHLYENREAVVVGTITSEMKVGVNRLLDPYRIRTAA